MVDVDADKPRMTGRDFDAELRAEEAARQAEGMPAEAARAVWARLEALPRQRPATAGRRRERPRRRATFLAGAAAVAGIAAVIVGLVALVVLRPAARLGDLEVASQSNDLAAHVDAGLLAIERGAATLIDRPSGLTIQTVGPVSMRREARGVRLVGGRIDVTVAHRPPTEAPATILVSHGAIEVMGTAFTVIQDQAGGRVALHAGSIRFRAADGAVSSLRPGDALAWPAPPAAAPSASPPPAPPAPSPPTPPAAHRAPPSAAPRPPAEEALLDHVEELRSRGEFEQAARALRHAVAGRPNPTRERLSFELGSLLTHQLRDPRRACAQWAWHERRFPDGRYRNEIASARRALACPAREGQ